SEGEDSVFFDKLTELLPDFIKLYDHIYMTLPETDSSFPWADGKPSENKRRSKKAVLTPLLGRSCTSKVSGAFVWPVFAAFRLLLEDDGAGGLRFKTNPVDLFDQKKTELSTTIRNTFDNQGQVVGMVGKTSDAWIRLEGQIEMEMMIRERMKATV